MKQKTIGTIILMALVGGIGGYAWHASQSVPASPDSVESGDENQTSTSTPETTSHQDETPSEVKSGLSWSESAIEINGETILVIDDFPDQIRVSDDAVFGGSERITGAQLSPSQEWIAVAVSGAVHSFGWVYNIEGDRLEPVAFQYGGDVEIKEWRNNTEVAFEITTPQPKTLEEVIDVTNLPEYPKKEESTVDTTTTNTTNTTEDAERIEYTWISDQKRMQHSGVKSWSDISTSRLHGFELRGFTVSEVEAGQSEDDDCEVSRGLRREGGASARYYCLKVYKGADDSPVYVTSTDELREVYSPVGSETKAISFVAVTQPDLRFGDDDILDGAVAHVEGSFLVQVVDKNTFGCGDHRNRKAIYEVTTEGEIKRVATEKLPPRDPDEPVVCVD